MTPRELITSGACCARCLLAMTPAARCRCKCKGSSHSALLDADISGLIEARRIGLNRLSDIDILRGIA